MAKKTYRAHIADKIQNTQESEYLVDYLARKNVDVESDLDRKVLQAARQAFTENYSQEHKTVKQSADHTFISASPVQKNDADAKLLEVQQAERRQQEIIERKKREALAVEQLKVQKRLEEEAEAEKQELARKQELSAQQAAKQARILKEKDDLRRPVVAAAPKRENTSFKFGDKKPGNKPQRTERTNRNKSRAYDNELKSKRRNAKLNHSKEDYKQVVKEIAIPKSIPLSELAHRIAVKASDVVKTLKELGEIVTVNTVLDSETAYLAVETLGHKPYEQVEVTIEETLIKSYQYTDSDNPPPRPPVVTVMGHVDHGKTTLLDYIRKARVAEKEAGGITQALGAYSVNVGKGSITFIDTPGHVAFSQMRARGANITDIVVLVVAANDGLMPQTLEAIEHANNAGVPIVVAINKIDLPDVDTHDLIGKLASRGLTSESWGGKTQMVEISAKQGTNVDKLLETILLESEILELKAPAKGDCQATVLEASVNQKKGLLTNIIVQSGTLKRGDRFLCNLSVDGVRAMFDCDGKPIKEAGPGTPVVLMGLSHPPTPGERILASSNSKLLEAVANERVSSMKTLQGVSTKVNLDDLFASSRGEDSNKKERRLILKADNKGSLEAIISSVEALYDDEVKFDIVSQGVGSINESDASLANTLEAFIIGFNVRADNKAQKLIDETSIEIYYYSIIYDLLDSVQEALYNLKAPLQRELILGVADVLDVFDASAFGQVAGCRVSKGSVVKGKPVRVLRDDIVIFSGELDSLRREKNNVNEVKSGLECGIGVKNYENIKIGDRIEIYDLENVVASKNTHKKIATRV